MSYMDFNLNADRNHTVEICRSGLSASTTLLAGSNKPSEHRLYKELEAYWKAQLVFAEKRQRNVY